MRTQHGENKSHGSTRLRRTESADWYVDKLGFKLERERAEAVGIKDESGLTIFLLKTAAGLAGQKITLTIQVDMWRASTRNWQASA